MKHRQVSAQNIAIRREMRLSEAIERLNVLVCDPCGQNERVTGFQSAFLVEVRRSPGHAVSATSISRFSRSLQAPSQAWADMP